VFDENTTVTRSPVVAVFVASAVVVAGVILITRPERPEIGVPEILNVAVMLPVDVLAPRTVPMVYGNMTLVSKA
jgi:hypothetical protein